MAFYKTLDLDFCGQRGLLNHRRLFILDLVSSILKSRSIIKLYKCGSSW